jgi:hypothetical protein
MEFYVCLVEFRERPGTETRKVLTTAIASTVDEVKEFAIVDAARQLGANLKTALIVEVDAHQLTRERLEEAARKVLGWSS